MIVAYARQIRWIAQNVGPLAGEQDEAPNLFAGRRLEYRMARPVVVEEVLENRPRINERFEPDGRYRRFGQILADGGIQLGKQFTVLLGDPETGCDVQ